MYKRLFSLVIALMMMVVGAIGSQAQDTVDITIRCKANVQGGEGWRCDNFNEVQAQVEADLGITINLTTIQDDIDWGDYKQEFVLASEAGEAPDIILSGHEDIGAWAPAGTIIPLDDMLGDYPEFADVISTLWESQKWDGKIWGVPQDAEARPIFYSKLLLRDLGWTEEEIDSLPDRVASGEFTFDDMIATAKQAIDEGVVAEGYGFWHRGSNGFDWLMPYYAMGGEILGEDGKLIWDSEAALRVYEAVASWVESGVTRPDILGLSSSEVYYPAVSSAEEVLFAEGGTWTWANMAKNYVADRGGNDYMLENIGLILWPAMSAGVPLTVTHPLSYMISSSSENPDVALALIAAVTTPDANNRHAIDSFHLGILNSQVESEEYLTNPTLSKAHYMLDYTRVAPNHPDWAAWSNAYWLGIQASETGASTPQEALDLATAQLQNEIGDNVTYK
jgi:inositol-phosphate transport system substrate-binding protein